MGKLSIQEQTTLAIINAINILEQARELETNTTKQNTITTTILNLEEAYNLKS